MADTRIWTTDMFAKRNASARLACPQCGHFVVVSGAIMNVMFRQSIPLDSARKRLRCTKCLARGPQIEVIYPRGR
jgi:hypothetical protein